LNQVQFDSIVFQERNGTCGMKPEYSGRNLAEKSETDWDLKWDKNYSILFCFLNWYKIFRPFWMKQNEINNLNPNRLCSHAAQKKIRSWQTIFKEAQLHKLHPWKSHTHNCLCISGFIHRPAGSITNFDIAIHGAITALEEHINYESKKQKEETPQLLL